MHHVILTDSSICVVKRVMLPTLVDCRLFSVHFLPLASKKSSKTWPLEPGPPVVYQRKCMQSKICDSHLDIPDKTTLRQQAVRVPDPEMTLRVLH